MTVKVTGDVVGEFLLGNDRLAKVHLALLVPLPIANLRNAAQRFELAQKQSFDSDQ